MAYKKRKTSSIARKVARKSYRTALRMNKRKLAKVFANKMGKLAFKTTTKKKKTRRKRRYKKRRY